MVKKYSVYQRPWVKNNEHILSLTDSSQSFLIIQRRLMLINFIINTQYFYILLFFRKRSNNPYLFWISSVLLPTWFTQ